MATEITKDLLRSFRADLDAALAPLTKKYGLSSLKAGSATYSAGGTFTMKVEGLADGGIDKDAERYNANRSWLELPPLGTKFLVRGSEDTIIGLTKGTKVITKRGEKKFVWDAEVVKRLCATKAAAAGSLVS